MSVTLEPARVMTRRLAVALLVGILTGCRESGQIAGANATVSMQQVAFADSYRLVDSIRLAQPDSAPLVRISGLAFDQSGRIAVADASEGKVRLYDRFGRLLRTLGRKGEGPGEFSQPRFPRFTPDGGLYIGDGQAGRVSRFDSAGSFTRVFSKPVIPIMGFELTPTGFALTGSGDGEQVLLRGDSTGGSERWLLDSRRLRPRADPDSPAWRFVTQYWLASGADSLFVVTTVSDSIWSIPLDGDTIIATRLDVPGYIQPQAAQELPRGAKGISEWQKTFHIAAKVIATDDILAVPFVQGILNYGDPMILAIRHRGRPWVAITGAPPIIHALGDTLVGLLHPDEDPPTLGLFVPAEAR